MAIDTKAVTGRRTLKFNSLDDILAELDRLEGKKLTPIGNWSVGQILAHIAIPINGAIDGMKFRPPWFIRMVARLLKKRFLSQPMPPGFKIPADAQAELIPPPTSEPDDFNILRKAIQRLKSESPVNHIRC